MGLSGFDRDLLTAKYAAMTTQANADMIRAQASAGLQNAQARALGSTGITPTDPLEGLKAGLLKAQTQQAIAGAGAARTQSSIADDENRRNQIAFNQSDAVTAPPSLNLRQRQAAAKAFEQAGNGIDLASMTPEQIAALVEQLGAANLPGSNKKGLAKVPKTGTTKVHKGEAILNKPAADKLGRGLIAALNVQGQQKMGMV